MLKIRNHPQARDIIFCIIIILVATGIGMIPMSKFYKQTVSAANNEARCVVLRTDNRFVFQRGTVREGDQRVTVRILDGRDRGREFNALNLLQGAAEMEWFYQPDEKAMVGYTENNGQVVGARMLEPLREGPLLWIFALFIAALLILAGWTGV